MLICGRCNKELPPLMGPHLCSADGCHWTEDDDGIWHTTCDNAFTLDSGTPSENKMAFCCYCGAVLVEHAVEGATR